MVFIYKHEKGDMIFDDKNIFNLITDKGKRKIWVEKTNPNAHYAQIWFNKKNLRVHHILMGTPLNGLMIGHLNGNGLDNRLENLKVVRRRENAYNRKTNKHGKYGRWVSKARNGKFIARIAFSLGTFDTPLEAHEIAKKYVKENFKDIFIHKDFI